MPLITPRRRFLITAPLAVLLPAGLLTYLGLETVGSVDIRYEQLAQKRVEMTISSLRNRTEEKFTYTIQKPFQNALLREIDTLFPVFPPPEEAEIHLQESFPAAAFLFVYGSDRQIYFFERKPDNGKYGSEWVRTTRYKEALATRLKSAIDFKVDSYHALLDPDTYTPEKIHFEYLRYPDELYPSDNQRELASFTLVNPMLGSEDNAPRNAILAFGFTVDFQYINREFFQNILDEMWQREVAKLEAELTYPIAIEDHLTGEWIATIEEAGGKEMAESKKHLPQSFHNDLFPWYKIHFSDETGEDIMMSARYEKMVYYCLIAAANVIMIAAVISALRNIAHELALSDMRSNFVARVSHELRTPLGLIRLYAETLELNRAKNEEKRQEYLRALTKECERLAQMINNILNFSRIEANKQQYTLTERPIGNLVLETAETMRYHFERHGLNLHVSADPALPPVRCDGEALRQALFNLLSNAMKYSGEGKNVWVNAYSHNGEVIIEVKDQGIGVSSDQRAKIFEEYHRVDDPLVRETGGTGLGLAVVKHIVESHRGRIVVDSTPGQGSTFAIHLPVAKPSSPAPAARNSA